MYILFWSTIFLFVGAFWQIIDARLGVVVYRLWYNITHEHPLPKEMRQGFIANRGSKAKTFWAFIGSSALCLAFVFNSDAGNFTKLILWLVGIPVIMIGFYIGGPYLRRLWQNRDAFFKRVDDLERGDPHTMDWLRKTILKVRTMVAGFFRTLAKIYEKLTKSPVINTNGPDSSNVGAKPPPSGPPPQTAHATVAAEPEQPVDPRELIKRFTEGQK